MHEQQNNMIVNNNTISTEKFQSNENCTREITKLTSPINGIYLINNNINNNLIKKTSPLSMPSGIVIMQPNQDKEINQQHHQNENYTSNKNTKDFILKTTNYNNKSQSIINNLINSHNINNSITTNTTKNIKKSAFNYNSDNNNLNHSKQQQHNNFNTIKSIDNQIQSTITSIKTVPPPPPSTVIINKNLLKSKLSSSSSSINDHLNVSTYNRQRSFIEDVHNYSKKSNNIDDDYIEMELSSNYSNNSSDDYETTDDFDELINTNKIKCNFDNKKNGVNETDNNNKWLKTINNRNDNNKILKKRKIQNNDDDDNDCINYNNLNNDDNHVNNNNNKLLKKSKTPDSGVPDDVDDKLTPDHHARRPMNAFLIFCKRHRAIVRDKYKNVENRQITKILGEWWANMTADEKSCYANLAKENKDQFLSANPNFKWYKLPAPPLRTLTTRPNNNTSEKIDDNKNQLNNNSDINEHISTIKNHISNNNNSTLNCQQHHKKLLSPISKKSSSQINNVGVFKFADETQMGSLNNLIGGDGNGGDNIVNSPTHSIKSSSLSPNNDAAQLQNALGETSDYLCNTITQTNFSQQHEPFENMRDHAKKMKNSKLNMKHKLLPSTNNNNIGVGGSGNKIMLRDNSFSSSGEDDCNLINRKLSRTCKGKKYEELIKSGQISILNKKSKKSNYLLNNNDDHSYNNTDNRNNNLKDSSSDSDYYNHNNISPINIQQNCTITNDINNDDDGNHEIVIDNNNTIMKKQQYDLIDFDLDSRIMSLPAQCLDQYLIKKQESKTKKKINTKRRNKTIAGSKKQNNNNNVGAGGNNKIDIKQQFNKEQIVGSQKRKARKESITRRDINAINNETAKIVNYVVLSNGNADNIDETIEFEIIEIKEENDLYELDATTAATDLHTLAEAASNADE